MGKTPVLLFCRIFNGLLAGFFFKIHVRGHSHHKGNIMADQLAGEGAMRSDGNCQSEKIIDALPLCSEEQAVCITSFLFLLRTKNVSVRLLNRKHTQLT